jgi:hypothetical protein
MLAESEQKPLKRYTQENSGDIMNRRCSLFLGFAPRWDRSLRIK